MLECERYELGTRGETELLVDVRAVRLDRAHGEVELRGDLGVGMPERDQPEYLKLTFS